MKNRTLRFNGILMFLFCGLIGACQTLNFRSLPPEFADLADHKAEIFFTEGSVQLLKKDSDVWIPAVKGLTIQEGDKIVTGADAHAEIAYDKHYLNISTINEKTRATFERIEPTSLKLEDGSVWSGLDGLLQGMQYEIFTPTAVAGVRGTTFQVGYDASAGQFSAATFQNTEPGQASPGTKVGGVVQVTQVKADGTKGASVEVKAGNQVQWTQGQTLTPNLIAPIPIHIVSQAASVSNAMALHVDGFSQKRQDGKTLLAVHAAAPSNRSTPMQQSMSSNVASAARASQTSHFSYSGSH